MDLPNILVSATFLVNILLFLIVHFRTPHTNDKIAFKATILAISGWCISMVLYRSSSDAELFWSRLLYFFPVLIPIGFSLFGLYFPNDKPKKNSVILLLIWPLVFGILALIPGAIVQSVQNVSGQEKHLVFGWAYPLYLLYIPLFFSISFLIFFKKIKSAHRLVKSQIQFFLIGLAYASFPAMLTNLILPTFGNFSLNWLGQVFTTLWIVAVGYAIIKHQFLDIRLIVARTVAYFLLLSILGTAYSGLVFLITRYLFPESVSSMQIIIYAVLALFVAITSQPLKTLLEKFTDHIFFKGKYNTPELISRLTTILATSLHIDDVTGKTLDELLHTMHITNGTFILSYSNTHKAITRGASDSKLIDQTIMDWLTRFPKLTILEEIEDIQVKQLLRKLNISIVLPLSVGHDRQGALLLGDKKSGEMYSQQDIKVLEIFGPEVSVAVQNAKAYEEIKQFNVTLHQEVERATKDLKEANEHLQELDQLKDEFVSLASHELRTPMTIIKNYLWMLSNDTKNPLETKQKEYVDRSYSSVNRLINLVNDMLNVSRIESGRFTINLEKVDITTLVKDTVTEIQPRAQELGIDLTVKDAIKPVPEVSADPERVKQVLINLIGNALKFTPRDGYITVWMEAGTAEAIVHVTDSGKGISVEDIPKLFQKFSIVGSQNLRKLNSQGTGLGLYLSKSIINLHKGKIGVYSNGDDKGTTFTFTLPYEKFAHVVPQADSSPAQVSSSMATVN